MAYEDLMKPDEDWRNLPDSAHRRRLQNRLAQRAYRRNLRKRNEEVEQLQQQIRELQDASRGTPPANEFAAMELNMPWDTTLQNSNATSKQSGQDITLSSQAPISGLPDTAQDSTNMQDFDFFMSLDEDMHCAPNPTADACNPHSIPTKQSSKPPKTKFKQSRHLNRSRRDCTPGSISDPTEASTSLSTSSSTSSCSRRNYTLPPLMAHSLVAQSPAPSPAPSPMHTPLDTLIDPSMSPWNSIDNPRMPFPRPSLSLVHLAVAAGNADTLRILLQDLALPVNKRDEAGYTPLQRAVMSGRADLVTVLLENGAGASTDDESDWSLDADVVAG